MKINLLYIFVLLLISCKNNPNVLNDYFKRLDKSISESERVKIKQISNLDSLSYIIFQNNSDFVKKFDSISVEIDKYLFNSFQIEDIDSRRLVLLIAYQKNLNKNKINLVEIKKEVKEYSNLIQNQFKNRSKLEERSLFEISRRNFDKFKIGDKMSLLLPVELNGAGKNVYLYNQYEKNRFTDTLFLTCVLKTKQIGIRQSSSLPKEDYVFILDILDATNRRLDLIDKRYRRGKTISLRLFNYGREIENSK